IDRAGRFIEHQDGRVFEKRSRERNPLAFATGKAHPTLADAGLIALRQFHNEIVRIGKLRGRGDVVVTGVRPRVGYVFGNGGREPKTPVKRWLDIPGALPLSGLWFSAARTTALSNPSPGADRRA